MAAVKMYCRLCGLRVVEWGNGLKHCAGGSTTSCGHKLKQSMLQTEQERDQEIRAIQKELKRFTNG